MKAPRYKVALGRQELIVYQTILLMPSMNVAGITICSRPYLNSKSKNLRRCVSWYVSQLKKKGLIQKV